ncbi:MAG: FAD-dependent oxidoreductase [Rubricoccaceae bacterium]|nr:FAD-dependent oxidoreductase [Rubricoccaceae bacterium]
MPSHSFDPTDIPVVANDVLVIGAGAAGLRAAIELAEAEVDVLVIGKRKHGDAHTVWAAGGINAALGSLDPEDRWDIHAADTLNEGHLVNDARAVELLARRAPERVRELDRWGADFGKTADGAINQRYFGAQSFRRTCFRGDVTGRAILDALVSQAKRLGIPYRQNTFVTEILTDDDGRAVGAVGYDMDTGAPLVFHARAVVLAAGGHTSVYVRSSSRPDENTGDAQTLAYDAGAVLRDMEFVQFHPTGKLWPEEERGHLVTEAVRGEGGRLYNRERERFMERYSPKQMELDARDVVARAGYAEIQAGRGTPHGGVWLDISHRDADYVRERLPRMVAEFAAVGVDITAEPMEVAPTAHYAMGGVEIPDFETCATSVPGLYAVGESVAGVHGANRLGGNSLAETVVFGQLVGAHLASGLPAAAPLPAERVRAALDRLRTLAEATGRHAPEDLIARLRTLMWDHAGIIRDEDGLLTGLAKLQALRRDAADLDVGAAPGTDRFEQAVNLGFMLTTCEAILRSALERTESRGAHYRSDHPDTVDAWRRNVQVRRGADGRMALSTVAATEPTPSVQQALREDHELDYHHLE